jgi:hypothetical protein
LVFLSILWMMLLSLAFVGGLVGGIVFWFTRGLRRFAPFVLLISPLAVVGGIGGSWGMGVLVDWFLMYSNSQLRNDVSFWSGPVGFLVGSVIGAALGLGVALLWRHYCMDKSS